MTLLILGLMVFFGCHLLPHFPSVRNRIVSRIGENPYKGLFALIALTGMVMLILGRQQAPYQHLYVLPAYGALRHVTYLILLLACISLVAMLLPCNLRRKVHHPMLLGIALWGTGHLLVNGDLASVLLFGSFTLYSLASIVALTGRGKTCQLPPQPIWKDGLGILLGIALYVTLVVYHQSFAGIALIG